VVYLTDYAEKHGYYRENGYFQEDFAVRGEEKTVRVKSVTRRERAGRAIPETFTGGHGI